MIPLLREALAGQARTVRFAILCAMLAALAGVGLLAIAGWFLAGAALAGLAGPVAAQGFNYLIPSAAVRAAAILRTGTRYGERMLGHRAALLRWPRCAPGCSAAWRPARWAAMPPGAAAPSPPGWAPMSMRSKTR
jgi:hypothetical protein